MSQQLAVSMLGSPSILLDGSPLVFPYRQAEAILYYLFLNKAVNIPLLTLYGRINVRRRRRTPI